MPISRRAAVRILIEALWFLVCVQLLLGNASGVQIRPSIGVEAGRKVLRDEQRNDIPVHYRTDPRFSFTSKIIIIGMPGMVIFGCVFPWFWRKKEGSHGPVSGDLNPMDSASSFETNSIHEKVPGSPMRLPPRSPMRYPPQSPNRRPPQSPNRRPPPQSPGRHYTSSPRYSPNPNKLRPLHLTYNLVVKATQNFSTSSYMGEGVGPIYKGRLPDGQIVAIQRTKKEHVQSAEFNNDLDILLRIDHRNLVRFLGYVDNEKERLIVTQYVPNGTLREHLDGDHGKILDFNQRLEISIDVGHGLTYLHMYAEKQIIHRDIKSSSILLTDNMRAKVADFGFARVGAQDTDHTHISTKVKGTVGYLDPEYMRTHKLTPQSDVYSFGVLLLEILTGRRPVDTRRPADEKVLIQWAFNLYREGNVVGLVDPQMKEHVSADILRKMFRLAFQCAAPVRADRPDMKEVGEKLWAIRMDYSKRPSG